MRYAAFGRLLICTFSVMAVLVFAGSALGQRSTRIKFARGSYGKTVTGTLRGWRDARVYVIRVKKGQTLTTESTGDNYITIGITPPPGSEYEQDMAADCHDRNEVNPTVAGDYFIRVVECKKADPYRGTFKFRVEVR